MGKRIQLLRQWIRDYETIEFDRHEAHTLSLQIEMFSASLFPFLRNPNDVNQSAPLSTLRNTYKPGSRGLIIPVGKNDVRFASHLLKNIRQTLRSTIPIQIVYAGPRDLPEQYRDYLCSLDKDISSTDITSIIDDTHLQLAEGGWAVKPFGMLVSHFEKAIIADADAVFLQPPEVLFDSPGFLETGTMLFHDRLIHPGGFPERHRFWADELAHTNLSASIRTSKAYTEAYAELGDSGVVAFDKSNLDVLTALLHICWQNTATVREKITYRLNHGDKESWWFGLELSSTAYTIQDEDAAIVGHTSDVSGGNRPSRVCSSVLAHVDYLGKLLWYNGSLLKNKNVDHLEFDVPTVMMVGGVWEQPLAQPYTDCMEGSEIKKIGEREAVVIQRSVAAAQQLDGDLQTRFPELLNPVP